MPKTIGLLAVPVVLAAAIVSATGAFAKAPAHQSAAASVATVKLSSAGSADAVKPAVAAASVPAAAPSHATTEPTESATEPASTETTDAAGGHADNPNDANADHQFNGEE
jgi:hypothetical protein